MRNWFLLSSLLLLCQVARAEIPEASGPVGVIDVEGMADMGQEEEVPQRRQGKSRRDPFAASDVMLIEAGRYSSGAGLPGGGFLPVYAAKPPKMKRLGFVNGGNKAVALLEIEGVGVFQVAYGDSISLHAIGREDSIKVRHVDSMKIEVQVGTVNSIIVR